VIPAGHLLRRINVFATAVLADLHEQLKAFYSDLGRPSVDPELMIRMLLVGYCYGIRHERRLCQEVALHLAYRWFCKLDLDDKVPHHSTFSVNRLGRFRESEILRHIFERVVTQCMAAGLVKGEGFAVDASVMEANASRYYGKALDELDWSDAQRQKRAVAEYLAGPEAEARVQEGGDGRGGGPDGEPTAKPDRKPPKVISPSDPSSAWTAKANKRVQFGYGLNYLIDVEHAIIVDVEPTPARTYDEVASTRTMLERTEQRLDLKPDWLAAIPPTAPANCLRGCWARTSRRISPCGKGIHRLMACSPVATSLMTRSGTSMSVPMAGSCEPREQSMMAVSGTTCHNLKTAVPAHSSNDARAHRSRRSRAISTRMHAIMPVH
jgi:transposase